MAELVSSLGPRSAASRRRIVERLLARTSFPTQAALVAELLERGYNVSQASISRDLRDLGAERGPDGWRLREARPGRQEAELMRVLEEWCIGYFATGELVILRTQPGAAQHVAARIDLAHLDSVAATIAGDDTILLIAAGADARPTSGAYAVLDDLGLEAL